MSHLDRVPGLTRMITVDNNTLPGRIEELPLDAHTVVLARNGSGKTSLIQLVPVFYGEKMASVINSHERDNFIHHYLPRESSYLAFEYRNHDGDIRSVVIHSDPSKEKIQYRFLRSGLSADMFSIGNDDGSLSFISNAGFDNRLRDLSIDFAPRLIISTKAYRGIIQGRIDDGTESRDRGYHRQLVNDYSMATAKAPLTGVEQLLTQMLRNNVSMKNLLGVVARQASDSGRESYKLLGESTREQIASWPKTFMAYRKVMDAEPKARDLLSLSHRMSRHQDDIRERFDALKAFEEDFISGLEKIDLQLRNLSEEKIRSQRDFELAIQDLSDKIAAHKSEIGSLGAEILRIKATGTDLQARGADKAQEEVARLPDLEKAIEAATARHGLLASRGEDVIRRFDAERLTLRDKSAAETAQAMATHGEAVERIDQEIVAAEVEAEQLAGETEAEGRAREAELRAAIEVLAESHSELRLEHAALQPDEEFALRKVRAEESLSEERAGYDLAKNQQAHASDGFRNANHAWEMATRNLRDADARVEAARLSRDAVEAEYNPKDGSLLAFLRRNRAGWGDSIGKVIRPDLLQKTSLSPDLVDECSDNIFGLLLDLDKIDLPDHADDTRIEARMIQASDAVERAEKEREDLAGELMKTSRQRKKAQDALAMADAALGVSRNKFDLAQKAHDTILHSHDRHLEEKGAGLSKKIERISNRLDQERQRLSAEISGLRERLNEIREEGRKRRQDLRARKAEMIGIHRAEVERIEARKVAGEARLREDQEQALSEKGLDAATITRMKTEIDDLQSQREAARNARNLAEEWERHLEIAAGLDVLEGRKSEAEFNLSRTTSALIARKQERDSVVSGFIDRIDEAEKTREAMTVSLQHVSASLKTAPGFVDPRPERGGVHDKGHEVCLQELGGFLRRLGEDRTALRNLIKVIAGVFRNCGDAGIAAYLDSKELDADFGNSWVPPIMDWYDHEHVVYRDTLMQGIGMIVEPMNIAYHALHKADREIASLNRKMAEAIRDNEGFPHVKDVKISIRSGITEQPCWPLMEAVNLAHTAWRNSPSDQPSEALIEALDAFLGHWEDGRDPVLRLEDMIYLDGHMTEGGNLRRFSRNTNLSELSSNGNIIILRLILFTALLTVMRRGRPARLVWSVDEIGALDIENSRSLLKMLKANGIVLLTAAPTLERRVKEHFAHHMRIDQKVLYRLDADAKNGIREWIADDQLDYPVPALDDNDDDTLLAGDAA